MSTLDFEDFDPFRDPPPKDWNPNDKVGADWDPYASPPKHADRDLLENQRRHFEPETDTSKRSRNYPGYGVKAV
jgi:hypothetical protein